MATSGCPYRLPSRAGDVHAGAAIGDRAGHEQEAFAAQGHGQMDAEEGDVGCFGGGVGLGFGNQFKNFPGGEECFRHFLSVGNEGRPGGPELAEQITRTIIQPKVRKQSPAPR